MFSIKSFSIGLALISAICGQARANDNTWYFSAEEISAAYRYQEKFGSRLRSPLKPQDCFLGKSDFTASFQGQDLTVPCRFVLETKRHLKLMIETGAARYMFPLDADHGHLAIPKQLFDSQYRKLTANELLARALGEPQLVALYHTAEHLRIDHSHADKNLAQTKDWQNKRNVLGFFDGRPLTILAALQDGSAHEVPEQFQNVATFYFLAHRLGELNIVARHQAISFDLSFDEDSTAAFP